MKAPTDYSQRIARMIELALVVPPIPNPEAEQCAHDLAAALGDECKVLSIWEAYRKDKPRLAWYEAQRIGARSLCLAKEARKQKAAK